jgi:hypothetical protein
MPYKDQRMMRIKSAVPHRASFLCCHNSFTFALVIIAEPVLIVSCAKGSCLGVSRADSKHRALINIFSGIANLSSMNNVTDSSLSRRMSGRSRSCHNSKPIRPRPPNDTARRSPAGRCRRLSAASRTSHSPRLIVSHISRPRSSRLVSMSLRILSMSWWTSLSYSGGIDFMVQFSCSYFSPPGRRRRCSFHAGFARVLRKSRPPASDLPAER